MMRQMREATKPIMIFTAAAFVALMVFQWGMDITGRSSGKLNEIGSVNGIPVTYDAYMAAYRNLYDQAQRQQGQPLTSQQNKQVEDQAFDDVVTQILIQQELDRRGIQVSNQEIKDAAEYSPPADLRSSFTDSTGQFNLQLYQQFLSQASQEQLLALEAYYRDVIPRGKLLRQVSSGIFLSDGELWQSYRDQHEEAQIQYVPFNPATRYPDSIFPVSQQEVETYYNDHQDDFKVPARATVKAVLIKKAPTPADTAAALAKADSVRQEIVDGADFAEVAKRESSDSTSAVNGGDLGTFAKGRMTPVFDSAVFAAPVGRVTRPVETSYGYHIIEVTKRWGQDSASARHILIPIERTDSSEIALLTMADSLESLSADVGLQEAATKLGLSAIQVEISESFPFLAGAGQIGEGADWATQDAAPGDVSPVFENDQAFYALQLVSSQPAGVLPLADAKTPIEQTLRLHMKMDKAKEDAAQLVAKVKGGEALPNAASDMGLEIRDAGPFNRDDFVPGVGRQNAVIGTAFGLKPGEVSNVITTQSNVFVVQLMSLTPADSTAWLQQKDTQRAQAIGQLQQQRLQEWLSALHAAAKIVDRRAQVLKPAEEQPTS
jgi:peptidyl-prolyl cis-trans isomerase D